MKVAIVHDELVRRGGAEQVTLLMHQAFPEAPIYTSCYNPQLTYQEFKACDVRVSWFNRLAQNETQLKRYYYPFSIWAMKQLDLTAYDVVFISTTTSAKFVKVSSNALLIAFCHYPFRLAWFPNTYSQYVGAKGLKKLMFDFVINSIKKEDFKAARRIDFFITNTVEIKGIIERCYQPRNSVDIIRAAIPCRNFAIEKSPGMDYYLVVSRMEPYKKVDLVIDAFNELPNKKLVIVGRGSQKENYVKKAKHNIEFKEGLTKDEISELYANCKGFIFPQYEDYGLTPIEANASGRPVIAFGEGGVTHTMIPFNGDSKKATALFFNEQTKDSLKHAIVAFEKLEFDAEFIRSHAELFDEKIFIKNVQEYVYSKYTPIKK